MSSAPRSFIRRRPTLVVASVVGMLAIALVAVLATRQAQPGSVSSSALTGRPAPPLSGSDIVNGKHVSLSALRGHFVVVNFFASWCPPCQTETPALVAFLYAERQLHAAAIGVVYNDSPSNAKSFLQRLGATWPAVTDPNGELAASYGVDDPPQAFLVAPNGRVVEKITGALTENLLLEGVGVAQAEGWG